VNLGTTITSSQLKDRELFTQSSIAFRSSDRADTRQVLVLVFKQFRVVLNDEQYYISFITIVAHHLPAGVAREPTKPTRRQTSYLESPGSHAGSPPAHRGDADFPCDSYEQALREPDGDMVYRLILHSCRSYISQENFPGSRCRTLDDAPEYRPNPTSICGCRCFYHRLSIVQFQARASTIHFIHGPWVHPVPISFIGFPPVASTNECMRGRKHFCNT